MFNKNLKWLLSSINFESLQKLLRAFFLILKLELVRLLTGLETSGSDSRKISTKGKKKQMFIHLG